MLPDGTYTGVVDRVEEDESGDKIAVIVLEDDGEVFEQLDVSRTELPSEVEQNSVLELTITDGEVSDVTFDPEKTNVRADEAQNRFDRLADQPPNSSEADPKHDRE